MNKFFIGILFVAVIGIGGFLFLTQKAPENGEQGTKTEESQPQNEVVNKNTEESSVKEVAIKITKDGFVPNQITIKAGDRVRFQNESGAGSWPASAMHPTHTVYPGSDIKKCDTPEEPGIFDACRELADGETWSFVFKEKGSWKYHDHVVSGRFGAINIE